MKKLLLLCILPSLLYPYVASAAAAETPGDGAADPQYLSVNVDRVELSTVGLASASTALAVSIDRLALVMGQPSTDSAALSDAEKQALLDAVRSAHQASVALTELVQQLPHTTKDLSDSLAQVISDLRAPLAGLSSGLQSARDSIALIRESLPQATENTNLLVNSALDAALQRLTLYTILLVAIVALALIAIMWFIYRQYLQPLMRKLDELVGAPEHFENMARYMKETASSLQALQDSNARGRVRSAERYKRQ
ncbi:MAG: hypothetical protein GY785_18545 [Gammaproteobacteria bacterium]|nr:hypothetical protein [Gammaproteobacteria bacterium]